MNEPSVVVVDDDEIVRSWVQQALAGSRYVVAAEAGSAQEALSLAGSADVLLVDYRLPDGPGTDLVRELRRRGVTTPALLMTANAETGLNQLARDAGGQGTLLKSGTRERLLEALDAVLAGQTSFDRRHPPREDGRAPLTSREREVLRLVAGGATNREVAAALGISSESVKTMLGRAFEKLGVSRRAEAVAVAQREGLL